MISVHSTIYFISLHALYHHFSNISILIIVLEYFSIHLFLQFWKVLFKNDLELNIYLSE